MSYNIARSVSPSFALCSFSSLAAGNVDFTFIAGDFTPNISSNLLNSIVLMKILKSFILKI